MNLTPEKYIYPRGRYAFFQLSVISVTVHIS